jgi:ribosome-associated protein
VPPATGQPGEDLVLAPGPGLRTGLVVPAGELDERFSRSSGPGGQSVNTSDSRVELRFDVARSAALTQEQRARAIEQLAPRLIEGVLSVTASEHRSQLQNRVAARARLVHYLREALAPPPPPRRATKPSRAARQRRLDSKKHRAEIKAGRARVREI